MERDPPYDWSVLGRVKPAWGEELSSDCELPMTPSPYAGRPSPLPEGEGEKQKARRVPGFFMQR